MSNPISTFWSAVDAHITASRASLGLTDSGRAEQGKTATLTAPGVLSWLDLDAAQIMTHRGKPTSLNVKLILFCVGSGKATGAEAVDSAIEIAVAVLSSVAGATLGGAVLSLADTPLDIIEANSNRPVVSITLDCTVRL